MVTTREASLTCSNTLSCLLLLSISSASRRQSAISIPPYEIAEDYTDAVTSLKAAYLRMHNGVFALWYPVIDGAPHLPMLNSIKAFVDSKLWHFELAVRDESVRGKMSSTGMLVINPPWTLATDLTEAFKAITQQLPFDSGKFSAECVRD